MRLDNAEETGIAITPEMVDAAMAQLRKYDLAWEYLEPDMMSEILRAALLRIKRAT